jgi:HAD superfamily phosphatase
VSDKKENQRRLKFDQTLGRTVEAVLFDMDGVLVDVTNSYRKTIQETVRHFTGKEATAVEIQRLKEKGGYNNDWDLTQTIIAGRGKTVTRAEVIQKFQELYLGTEGKRGLIESEEWLLSKEVLGLLCEKFQIGIVTGRPKKEAFFVLRKFKVASFFDVVVAMEDYPTERSKPDPYPVKLALERIGKSKVIYVGDSVDDITSAKRAGIRAIGCIPPGADRDRLTELLLKTGAEAVLDKIDDICRILFR